MLPSLVLCSPPFSSAFLPSCFVFLLFSCTLVQCFSKTPGRRYFPVGSPFNGISASGTTAEFTVPASLYSPRWLGHVGWDGQSQEPMEPRAFLKDLGHCLPLQCLTLATARAWRVWALWGMTLVSTYYCLFSGTWSWGSAGMRSHLKGQPLSSLLKTWTGSSL